MSTEQQDPRGVPEAVAPNMIRRTMAKRMSAIAGEVPQFNLRSEIDISPTVAHRHGLKREASDNGPVPSLNDYVVAAVARCLRRNPNINASYTDNALLRFPRVNVGIALAAGDDLLVPVIHDADALSVGEIATKVRGFVAQAPKFPPAAFAGGTFTVSNLGMMGITNFDPIVNAPEAAILGVGKAGVQGDRTILSVTLGCDHRILTGAEGARFLSDLADLLASPHEL